MKRLIIIAIIGFLSWQGYLQFQSRRADAINANEVANGSEESSTKDILDHGKDANRFQCDGRTHCSQMTSCAEATYFLRNCPDTKMDGNNDGVPCEKQWCQ